MANAITVPHYTRGDALQLALNKIKSPPGGTNYESHVADWCTTVLGRVFTFDDFLLGAEAYDPQERSRPDLVVTRAQGGRLIRHVFVELKKKGGDHLEKALDQASRHIAHQLENDRDYRECFVIVQRGLDIGFFEYHVNKNALEEYNIPNFRGCVSLTHSFYTDQDEPFDPYDNFHEPVAQAFNPWGNISSQMPTSQTPGYPYGVKFVSPPPRAGITQPQPPRTRIIIDDNIPGLKTLSFGNYRGRDPNLQQLFLEGQRYTIPCVFNIEQHQEEIEYLLHYMRHHNARMIQDSWEWGQWVWKYCFGLYVAKKKQSTECKNNWLHLGIVVLYNFIIQKGL